MRALSVSLLVMFVLSPVLIGCGNAPTPAVDQGDTTPVALVNTVCPIQGGPVDESVTAEWNGKQVGFCCPECIPTWNELSDEEKTVKLAEADSADAEHDDAEHDHMHNEE